MIINEICFDYCTANYRSTVQVRKSRTMNIFKYLMKTTREGISIQLEESGGCDTIRTHKFSPKKINPKRHMEPESLNQKLITKYTASKARKRDVAKTTQKN